MHDPYRPIQMPHPTYSRALVGLLAALAALAGAAHAALAPQYQQANDLDVMVAFVKRYPRVASTLRSMDMQTYTVHFGTDCVAAFERPKLERAAGWAGPAEPLVLARTSCKLE